MQCMYTIKDEIYAGINNADIQFQYICNHNQLNTCIVNVIVYSYPSTWQNVYTYTVI